jgi:hypothetical protein
MPAGATKKLFWPGRRAINAEAEIKCQFQERPNTSAGGAPG